MMRGRESIHSTQKLKLLLQRSCRYSFRQRCCRCCPTILCELFFPLLLMVLIVLTRYGTNAAMNNLDENSRAIFHRPRCSQTVNSSMISSNEILKKCFSIPPRYEDRKSTWNISRKINMIIRPVTNETSQLVQHARDRLKNMNCMDVQIS